MAASSSQQPEFEVPEGWKMVMKANKKSYKNILGQTFYSESDLMRYINCAKARGYSIYAPDFIPPTTGPYAMGSKQKIETTTSRNPNHAKKRKINNQKEVDEGHDAQCLVTKDELQCAKALLEMSGQGSDERRVSRRISGCQPELQIDFDFNRSLEYVINDKRRKSRQ